MIVWFKPDGVWVGINIVSASFPQIICSLTKGAEYGSYDYQDRSLTARQLSLSLAQSF